MTEAAEVGLGNIQILSLIIHLHPDHALYGPIPVPTALGRPPGILNNTQLEVNFDNGESLID